MALAMKDASFLDAVKTVLSGAIGVRRKSAHERSRVKPLHIVAAALLFVAIFIGTLVGIVRIVLG
ncbi:MAG TPA: DUF2970 domain-containing protein [Burkholderiales bacterium]|nr:DUF2970 domain-containing protein [Burkholderiales bacterium]